MKTLVIQATALTFGCVSCGGLIASTFSDIEDRGVAVGDTDAGSLLDADVSTTLDSASDDDQPKDASVVTVPPDASYAAPCLGPTNMFYVEGSGGVDGSVLPERISGGAGTWNVNLLIDSLLQVYVDAPSSWTLQLRNFDPDRVVSTGDYTFQHGVHVGTSFDLKIPGSDCGDGWTGSARIEQLVTKPTQDPAPVRSLIMTFQAVCNDESLSGCVSYHR